MTYATLITTRTKVIAVCHVHKKTNGTSNDTLHPLYSIDPDGLNKKYVELLKPPVTTPSSRSEVINEPWIDPVATTLNKNLLICISPGSKGGTWKTKHEYDGSLGLCSTTWYYTLQGINPIPSQSLPPAP